MKDFLKSGIKGWMTIRDADTREILVDKANAIHNGNISTEIAKAFIGTSSSFITYMAFGNGAVSVDTVGKLNYKAPLVSNTKNPSAALYDTTLVVDMTNAASIDGPYHVTVPGGNTQNFEDIVCTVTLPSGMPSGQETFDNPLPIIGGEIDNTDIDQFVFNEIALYTGQGPGTVYGTPLDTQTPIDNFLDADTTLITHIIFHPVQKSQNRTLEITYTLRIQMGD